MKILHVNHFMDTGGTETALLELSRAQKKLGHDVTICSMFGEGALDYKALEYGIPVVHLRSKGGRIAKILSLYKYLGKHRYDVMNSHWGVWLATAMAGFLRGIPRVHTNHSNQPRRLFLEHRVASFFTNKVVILTTWVEPYIAKWVAVPARKLVVIPNGLDFSRMEEAERIELDGIPPEAAVVGMIARLSPPKDYPTYMQAAQRLNETHPDVHFLAIGTGAQEAAFRQSAVEMGLKNFHFLGSRHDVPSLLRRMTVNVLASRHEGQGLGLLEAMIAGCPSIGSDIPAVRYTLEDGASGLLVKGQDPEALAEAMAKLLDDPALRERLVARAKVYAENFRSSQMAERYLAVYGALVGSRSVAG